MDSENFSFLEEIIPLPHVLTLILCYLDVDTDTLKNTKLSCIFIKEHVEYLMRIPSLRIIFENKYLIEKLVSKKGIAMEGSQVQNISSSSPICCFL